MPTWSFEPGHTTAHFCSRHMMVTKVRGQFSRVEGTIDFDPADLTRGSVEARIDTTTLWTGTEIRDHHLRSPDFLDVDNHPEMVFVGDEVEAIGADELRVAGLLTVRGVTREVMLDVHYRGSWSTPFWEKGIDKGPIRRAGFEVTTRINRHDFGVDWNDRLPGGGVIVSAEVDITIDAEALESGIVDGI